MFIVIIFIFIGIAIGYIVRRRAASNASLQTFTDMISRLTTWLIWLLLLLLGIEVGSNEQLISALPTLGIEALLLSSCATLGSCALAWALWKTMKGDYKP